jgi:uncharacterized protein (TIGR03435 family)
MEIRLAGTRNTGNMFLKTGLATALISTMWTPLLPQSPSAQALSAQSPATSSQVPDWQTVAGGKMEFEVASVKQDTTPPSRTSVNSNIPLGPQDMFAPTGGLLSATNFPLLQYMIFAYKLTPNQVRDVEPQLPKWASTDRFDIQARAAGNPNKDQFRLMMQALLADRFKLGVHFETRQLPVLALVLDKPGKLGPQLRPHPSDTPCSTAPPPAGSAPGPSAMVAGGFPEICGVLTGVQASAPGRFRGGARNVPLAMLASTVSIPEITGVDRPVLDKTGLTGTYDFVIEFTPQFTGPVPPGANFQPDPTGPTFLEALKEQLGLKLESQTGPVDVIVVDHVDHPSEN